MNEEYIDNVKELIEEGEKDDKDNSGNVNSKQ